MFDRIQNDGHYYNMSEEESEGMRVRDVKTSLIFGLQNLYQVINSDCTSA